MAFLARLREWASVRNDIRALLLVGSYARGSMRPDSDVLMLVTDPQTYLGDLGWTLMLGVPRSTAIEPYGVVTSVRVRYDEGLEVEFGIAPRGWASQPLDRGTENVAMNGLTVLMDLDGDASALADAKAPSTRSG